MREFRSLAEMLQPPPVAVEADPRAGPPVLHESETENADLQALAREVRLFHARVIEAVDTAVEMLVEDIAADVLARELLLEPANIEAIVDRALQRFAGEEPLRIRVHHEELSRVSSCGVPIVADTALRPGDAILELKNGTVDASLGARTAALLEAMRA